MRVKQGLFVVLFLVLTFNVYAKDCPFCKKEVINNQQVLKGKTAFVMYNYRPAISGHLMAVPIRHIENFNDLTKIELDEIGDLIKISSLAINKVYSIDNYIVIQKNGNNTGRTVEHVHFHILPIKGDHKAVLSKAFDLDNYREQLSDKELNYEVKFLRDYFAKQKI